MGNCSCRDSDVEFPVTMPTTPGQRSLDGVDREKLIVDEACKDVYSCEVLKCPTAQRVLEDMARSDIIHFACHGASDPTNPSDSHLLLQRIGVSGPVVDRLTVSSITNIEKPGRAWIAYLSACSTAEVKASSLADEGLHIVSAFQVAGFAHVIGSLWSVDDDVCAQVARLFYEDLTKSSKTLYSNRSVAAALRSAVLQVRSTCDPSTWAAFIHSGA
jgi:CHAT domain-containing protein